MSRTGVLFWASILVTFWSSRLPTQIDPAPAVMGPGRVPTGMSFTTVLVFVSITATEFGSTGTDAASSLRKAAATATRAARRSAAAMRATGRRQRRTEDAGDGRSGGNSATRPSAFAW